MKNDYPNLTRPLFKKGFFVLSFMMAFFFLGLSTAFAQTQLKLTIECHGRIEIFDRGSGTVVTTIQGPVENSTLTLAAGQLIRLRSAIPSQFTGYEVTEWKKIEHYNNVPPAFPEPNVTVLPHTANIDLVMGANGTATSVTAFFKIKDPSIVMTDQTINTVTSTPVILPLQVTYNDIDSVTYTKYNDPVIGNIVVDFRLDVPSGFPAGAQIIKVSNDGGTTNMLTGGPYTLGAGTTFRLYENILGTTPPTLASKNNTKLASSNETFEITFAGITTSQTTNFTFTAFGYIDDDVCFTDFADADFSLVFNTSSVAPVADFDACYDSDFEFAYDITYPTISNLDNRIKNDAKIEVYTASGGAAHALNSGASIEIYYEGSLVTTYSLTAAYSTLYLSAMLNGDLNPSLPNTTVQTSLQGHSGTDDWDFTIIDAEPGNYYVDVTNFAYLEGVEYAYDGDEFLVRYIGALDVDMADIQDINTITSTPVIVPVNIVYPDLSLQNIDAAVVTDARISSLVAYPAGAQIIGVSYEGGANLLGAAYPIGGSTEFYLSQVLGTPPTGLNGHSNLDIDWEITIDGIDVAGQVTSTVQAIAYITSPIHPSTGCYSVLDEDSFTVTFADALVDNTILPTEACYATPDNPTTFTVAITYPSIVNVDTDIKANAMITTDREFPIGTVIEWNYNSGAATGSYTLASALPASGSIYLSEIVSGIPGTTVGLSPLQGHSGTDTWALSVKNFAPGTYNLTIDGMAQLNGTDYIYDSEDVKIIKIGALDVDMADILDIQTIENSPVIIPVNIVYPDLAAQTIDPSVLTDARISTTPGNFPNSGKIIEMKYEGVSVWTGNFSIEGINEFYLSTVLGTPPTSLLGHSNLNIDWEITVVGIDYQGTLAVPVTVEAIAYTASPISPGTGCYSVMDSDNFTVTYRDAALTNSVLPNEACYATPTDGETEFTITIDYPAIENLDTDVLANAKIVSDVAFGIGTVIGWEYNGTSSGSYTLTSAASTLYLSEIVSATSGNTTGLSPLQGHSGTDTWVFTLSNFVPGTYNLTINGLAQLGGIDYELNEEEVQIIKIGALGVDLANISDFSTIISTPVIVPVSVTYPDLSLQSIDPSVLTDARITTTLAGGFPAGAEIFKVTYEGGSNLLVAPYSIAGLSEFYLSQVLGSSPTSLLGHSLLAIDWEIFIDGITSAVSFDVLVEGVAYTASPIAPGTGCYSVLDSDGFTATYADVTFAPIADITECHPANVVIEWTESYPLVDNVGGDRVLNDSKFTFFKDAAMTIPVALPVGTQIKVTTPVLNTWTSTLTTAVNTVYGSAVVAVQAGDPSTNVYGYIKELERPASVTPANWKVEIIGAPAGTLFVKVEHMALLDLDGSSYFGATPPFGPHGTFVEYVFNTDDFKVIYVGAANVVTDIMPGVDPNEIYTVSGAPIIVPVNVTYPDLTITGQNIDPSVLTDARITGLTNNVAGWPSGAKIIEVKYEGTTVFSGSYTIPSTTFLLSDVLGAPAPTALLGHSGLDLDWELTLADVTAPCTVTSTVEAIAYVDYNTCYSVMNTTSFTAVWADFSYVFTEDPAIVCEGSTVTGSTFTVTYPVIAQNPVTIVTDAEITVNEIIPNGTEIKWGYNAPATNTYTVNGDWAANTVKKLSEIVGLPAPTPLNGHSGLTITWNFEFVGLDALDPGDTYEITVQPIATLNSTDYDLSDANTPLIQDVEIYEVPDATISNNDLIYSGGTYTFTVDQHMYGAAPTYPTYAWTSDVSAFTTFNTATQRDPSVTFIYPYTGDITLTCVVNNGVCSDSKDFDLTVLPNQIVGQVKYYNSQESPMPSPFMSNYNGMDVPDYFYVSLVDNQFNSETDDPYNDAIEVIKVEEYYKEIGPLKYSIQGYHPVLTAYDYYEAAFGFYTNVDPTKEYQILVWDGGYYEESPNLGSGYLGQNWTWNNWGGVNATDALLVQHMVVGTNLNGAPYNMSWLDDDAIPFEYGPYAFDVADVNRTNTVSSLDALLVSRRAVGLIQKFTNNKPNFAVAGLFSDSANFNTNNNFGTNLPDIAFDKLDLENYNWATLAGQHYYSSDVFVTDVGNHYLNIYYDAVGDINASYVPQYGGFKIAPTMELIYENDLTVAKGQEITLPVTLDAGAELGALSLGLNYRNDLIEVLGTNYGEDFASVDQNAGTVRVAWAATEGASFSQGDPVVILTVRIKGDIPAGTRLFELDGFTELADVSAQVIGDVNFKTSALTTSVEGAGALNVSNYPNPFASTTTINYSLPEAGAVKLVVYNKMGQLVKTFVDEYQSEGVYTVNVNSSDLMGQGVYYYKLEVKGESRNYSSTNNLVLIK